MLLGKYWYPLAEFIKEDASKEVRSLLDFLRAEKRGEFYTPDGENLEFHINKISYHFKRGLVLNNIDTAQIKLIKEHYEQGDTFSFIRHLYQYKVQVKKVPNIKEIIVDFMKLLNVSDESWYIKDNEYLIKSYVHRCDYKFAEYDDVNNTFTLYPGILFYIISEYKINQND